MDPSTTRGWKRKKTTERAREELHKVSEQFVKSIADDRTARREEHTQDRTARREEHNELLQFNSERHRDLLIAQDNATRSARQTGVEVATGLNFIAESMRFLAEGVHSQSRGG